MPLKKKTANKSVFVRFEPEGKKLEVKLGSTILDAAKTAGVRIRSECGGQGKCGKCLVIVEDQSKLNSISNAERQHISDDKLKLGYRLACQSIIGGTVTVFIPPQSRLETRKIQTEGMERSVEFNPAVKKIHIILPKPELRDITPDFERLCIALKKKGFNSLEIDYKLLKTLPIFLRNAEWDVTVALWKGKEVIAVEKGNTVSDTYGFSVDIGTSKMVGYLVNLTSGETISVSFTENPQIACGEDIISRIDYTVSEKEGLKKLQLSVIEAINSLIKETCLDANVKRDRIYEITVAGNTAMHHIFLGISPKYLAVAPYVPAIKRSVNVKAEHLGLKVNPLANVYVLPIIAGFVGADAVADVLATGIYETDDMNLLIDIGTNGEVFVGNREDIVSCSCAAGPAFEGMHLEHGMKAVTGAIESLRIDPKDYGVEYKTIGDAKPIGICGSGMIDAVAEMFKCRIIDSRGHFNKNIQTDRLRRENGQPKFVIAWKEESGTEYDVTVSQKDVQEILLAKAAIHTGAAILMKEKKVREQDIDHVYIAGAFGGYLNPESAKFIGLIPDVEVDKINFVGNTAISGAKICLISANMRDVAEKLSENIRYIELTTRPDFHGEFINSLSIPHRNLKKYPRVAEYFRKAYF